MGRHRFRNSKGWDWSDYGVFGGTLARTGPSENGPFENGPSEKLHFDDTLEARCRMDAKHLTTLRLRPVVLAQRESNRCG